MLGPVPAPHGKQTMHTGPPPLGDAKCRKFMLKLNAFIILLAEYPMSV